MLSTEGSETEKRYRFHFQLKMQKIGRLPPVGRVLFFGKRNGIARRTCIFFNETFIQGISLRNEKP